MQDKEYILEFLVLEDGKEKDGIEELIIDLLGKSARQVEFEVFVLGNSHFKLSFTGKNLVIERVNDEIRKSFMKLVPLKDELGDEIREQAFIILSRIEQSLRSFVGSCMLDYDGFDWETHGNMELAEGQKTVPLHPLERTYFGDLIRLLNSKYTLEKANQPLTYGDIVDLCSQCETFDEFKELVAEQTKEVHLWDEVFSKFVEDKIEWKKLGGLLKSVINIRNAVMHHRPIKTSSLEKLAEIDALVTSITSKPQTAPSKADQEMVGKALHDLSLRIYDLGLKLAPFADSLAPLRDSWSKIAEGLPKIEPPIIGSTIPEIFRGGTELQRIYDMTEPFRSITEDLKWRHELLGPTFPDLGLPLNFMETDDDEDDDDDDVNGDDSNEDNSKETNED